MKEIIYENKFRKPNTLFEGEYEGFSFLILSFGTHPCAYVELNPKSPYFGDGMDNIELPVNGGVTYSDFRNPLTGESCKNYWIGWDYAHWGDYTGFYEADKQIEKNINGKITPFKKWTTSQIYSEIKDAIEEINKLIAEGGSYVS